jgi:phage FluMu gp28-like protein
LEAEKMTFDSAIKIIFEKGLFPYQAEFLAHPSRLKIYNKARQIGISQALALDAWLNLSKNESSYFVSRTERQSIGLMDKFFAWGRLLQEMGVPIQYEVKGRTEAVINGNNIVALTSNATGDEGFSGNVMLDEFGLFQNDEQIYRSVFPIITKGFKLSVVSRPFGQSNYFYRIFSDPEAYSEFARFQTNVLQAIEAGCDIDLNILKSGFGSDDEGYRENYMCEFIDESTSFYSYDLIRSCIGEDVQETGETFLGVDVGRKKDLTVAIVGRKLGNRIFVNENDVHVLKAMPFEEQESYLSNLIKTEKISRGGIDSTGLGMMLAEKLHKKHFQIEGVNFTNQSKEEMAFTTKSFFESKNIQIPDNEDLINDIHSIKKQVTTANNIRFDAERTSIGHADRFWAIALLCLMCAKPSRQPRYKLVT